MFMLSTCSHTYNMASIFPLFLFLGLLLFSFIPTNIAESVKRRALLPVTKDAATNQYVTVIHQRTPLVPVKLTVDLGGRVLWVDCENNYVSSSKTPVICDSTFCRLSYSGMCSGNCTDSSPKNDCTCSHLADNPITRTATAIALNEDFITLHDTDGTTAGPFLNPGKIVFGCADTSLLKGLAQGVQGIAGLGNGYVSIPYQLAYRFSRARKIGLCLSSSTTSPGVIFFGHDPYIFHPDMDVSNELVYTPLLKNPISTAGSSFSGEPSTDYFIGVKSIKVNGELVPMNEVSLEINQETGKGGTKISTIDPYTVLESSIYKTLIKSFRKSLSKVPRVKKIAPFELCYNRSSLPSTRVGPGVPPIEFVLQGLNSSDPPISFIIFGSNSMVSVTDDVLCLGFVNGGKDPTTSIVIGGHQLENNFLQFDIDNKRVGFSNSLLFRQTTCANFKFSSHELGGSEIM